MKLEELAGAITELKEKLLISIQEESAADANETLLTELRKRIMAKQPDTVKKKIAPKPVAMPADKKLNEQQSKFLKSIPEPETQIQEKPDLKRATQDSIQIDRSSNGYTISIDSELSLPVKNGAKVTDGDMQKYLATINENAKKQLDQLL